MEDYTSMLASLCDAIKRLEYGILQEDYDSKEYFVRECKKRRNYVEKVILRDHD